VKQLQPLGDQPGGKNPNTGGVAAGMIETADEAILDRVAGSQENDWRRPGLRPWRPLQLRYCRHKSPPLFYR
jgi:hypothetical protein